MSTIIVWFRNDLRVMDNPALTHATRTADRVVPVFILDESLLTGKHASANRNRFLIQSLIDLRDSLLAIGGDLIIREGRPETALGRLCDQTGANLVHYAEDYSLYASRRDDTVDTVLRRQGVHTKRFPGRLIMNGPQDLSTLSGSPYQVFTPFYRAWAALRRRDVFPAPRHIHLPTGLERGQLPDLASIANSNQLSPDAPVGGERAARVRFEAFLAGRIASYHLVNNDLALDATSKLSPYLHFGNVSPRELESRLPIGDGAAAWRRQLCWRDFYHYILAYYPENARHAFQPRYRGLRWDTAPELLNAWRQGRTGYPLVDAAMRQLARTGWMHNRSRLIVGSFLTKDLWIDWREGERYFMQLLVDGDEANNNGNWQWIASVGVDPSPVYRRLYNPVTQHRTHDPASIYVRRYVPELARVPDEYICEPWTMPPGVQLASNCVIGTHYPAPIVDHMQARARALAEYAKFRPV